MCHAIWTEGSSLIYNSKCQQVPGKTNQMRGNCERKGGVSDLGSEHSLSFKNTQDMSFFELFL